MSNLKSIFTFAVAIAGTAIFSNGCFAQAGSFAYPATATCSQCGQVGCTSCQATGRQHSHPRIDSLKSRHAQAQANNAKVAARNAAWPKPFQCADRQLYFSIWQPMIDQGYETHSVLSSIHFDSETNELSKIGQHTVAGIMQNMPATRKEIFIHRDGDSQLNQARMDSVKSTINTFYGQMGPARVAFSEKLPGLISGEESAQILQLSSDGRPAPVISISSDDSVSSAVGN